MQVTAAALRCPCPPGAIYWLPQLREALEHITTSVYIFSTCTLPC